MNPDIAGLDTGWSGRLQLDYRFDQDRTLLHDRHHGPLRVLKALHPEGPAVCHSVLVHPPGGIVGGDRLVVDASLGPQAHALITTPGATRFYRSQGATALQTLTARVAHGARLEWLPLETIVHRSAIAENRMRFELAEGAQMIGWDVLALGLPARGEAFDHGRWLQQIELPGAWLERARITGDDERLRMSPLGLAGHDVIATAWFAAGEPLPASLRGALLDAARQLVDDSPLAASAGATATHDRVVVLRALAHRVEPAMALLQAVRAAWRAAAWRLAPHPPRVWRT